MSLFFKALVIIVGIVALPISAHAQKPPTTKHLSNSVSNGLPGYWRLQELRIVRTSDIGNAETPIVIIRFEADATPTTDLYVATGDKISAFQVVTVSYKESQKRTLYGTTRTQYRAGQGSGTVNIENPVKGLGVPRDMFNGLTIVLGSDREIELRRLLASSEIAAIRRNLNKQLENLRTSHQDAISALTTAHNKKISQLKASQASAVHSQTEKLTDLKASHESEVNKLVSAHKAQMNGLRIAHEDAVSRLKKEHISTLASMRDRFATATNKAWAALQDEYRAKVAKIRREHKQKSGALIATLEEELARLETGYKAKIKRAKEELKNSEELLKLYAAREKSILAEKQQVNKLLLLSKSLQNTRKTMMSDFAGTWIGTVRCTFDNHSYNVTVNFTEASTTGLSGTFTYGGRHNGDGTITMALDSESDKFPVKARITTNVRFKDYTTRGRGSLGSAEGALYQNRSFTGSESWGGEYSCAWQLSQR